MTRWEKTRHRATRERGARSPGQPPQRRPSKTTLFGVLARSVPRSISIDTPCLVRTQPEHDGRGVGGRAQSRVRCKRLLDCGAAQAATDLIPAGRVAAWYRISKLWGSRGSGRTRWGRAIAQAGPGPIPPCQWRAGAGEASGGASQMIPLLERQEKVPQPAGGGRVEPGSEPRALPVYLYGVGSHHAHSTRTLMPRKHARRTVHPLSSPPSAAPAWDAEARPGQPRQGLTRFAAARAPPILYAGTAAVPAVCWGWRVSPGCGCFSASPSFFGRCGARSAASAVRPALGVLARYLNLQCAHSTLRYLPGTAGL